jgi:AcrR family transcriptional regulator
MVSGVRQAKRQKIIDAAVRLFSHTHDIKKVSIQAIAQEAAVSPTTIYNNFGGREKLIYEVVKVLVKRNLQANRRLIRSRVPFAQKLTGIISGKLDLTAQVNAEIIEKMVSQDRMIAPFVDRIYRDEIRPLWREILADGKKQGYIDPGLDDEALLTYLDVMKAGLSARQDILKGLSKNIALIQQLTRLMFYGFLKKDMNLFKEGSN